mmetsp:Transcript_37308/g.88677  ORF Transcript_37308/g.88677 Transcript_37308/m.88677 type:complete len:211 (+) Transcript_37308:324-956(+)
MLEGSRVHSRAQVDADDGGRRGGRLVPDDPRRERAHGPALDPPRGDHEVPGRGGFAKAQPDVLHRHASKAVQKPLRPRHPEADVVGPELRHRDPRPGEQLDPCSIRAELRPARAAEGEKDRVGAHLSPSPRLVLDQDRRRGPSARREADPAPADVDPHPEVLEEREPGPEHRRGPVHQRRRREHAARRPDEGLHTKSARPSSHIVGAKVV